METGVNLTGYDFVVVGLLLLFIARGLWLGFLRQVTGLVALFVSYYIASQYHDRLFPFLKDLSDNPTVIFMASIVILFLVTYIITLLLGKGLSRVIEIVISKWFDKLLGAVFGGVMGALVVVMLHMVLSSIMAPENTMLRECQTCPALNSSAEYARTFIDDEEVRKSLTQQSPAISVEDVMKFFDDKQQESGAVEKSTVVE
ncbi:CvpA family protein [Desulfopila inferna]|mgnify:CR=1 FL=1|uniref:CvpA family protein n=1 Tax=Desulfopila inferna TaxID=468528 RepID=UPI0019651417|nr:CvpA family protein [Desulfopila inferna]MBM9605159.1 CvpA family protein [Desulfopila inferna]